MTNLNLLKTSLTKEGAHKIAILLRHYDRTQVLKHLSNSFDGINIDLVAAKKNLSADSNGEVPALWDEARAAGKEALDSLVLLAIIFSHKELIKAFQHGASSNKYMGRIENGSVISSKTFTNFSNAIVTLGYGKSSTPKKVDYDFSALFKIPDFNKLVSRLLLLKLNAAKWDGGNDFIDEMVHLEFHKVLSIDDASFRLWISVGQLVSPIVISTVTSAPMPIQADNFFVNADEAFPQLPFVFRSGHLPKKTGVVKVSASLIDSQALLLHNAMQTKLYESLVAVYGTGCVGTENGSGSGTSIDLVVQTATFRWFYEIKTADSVRVCIRQAIPQLLEYAYWQCDATRTDKLIIVGPLALTPDGEAYLKFLRDTFNVRIYYESCAI